MPCGVTVIDRWQILACTAARARRHVVFSRKALDLRGACRYVHEATRALPIIGDADTGYGNAVNVKRTLRGFVAAGFAGIIIEDQACSGHGLYILDTGCSNMNLRVRACAACWYMHLEGCGTMTRDGCSGHQASPLLSHCLRYHPLARACAYASLRAARRSPPFPA